jgi:hypothetical protein
LEVKTGATAWEKTYYFDDVAFGAGTNNRNKYCSYITNGF